MTFNQQIVTGYCAIALVVAVTLRIIDRKEPKALWYYAALGIGWIIGAVGAAMWLNDNVDRFIKPYAATLWEKENKRPPERHDFVIIGDTCWTFTGERWIQTR